MQNDFFLKGFVWSIHVLCCYKIPIKHSDLKEGHPSLQNLIHCAVTIVWYRKSSSDKKWYIFFCYHDPCTHNEGSHWLKTERSRYIYNKNHFQTKNLELITTLSKWPNWLQTSLCTLKTKRGEIIRQKTQIVKFRTGLGTLANRQGNKILSRKPRGMR